MWESKLRSFFSAEYPLNTLWEFKSVSLVLLLVGTCVFFYWIAKLPSSGKAIGAVGVIAGAMSVRRLDGVEKFLWVCLLLAMLYIEYRAINRDRKEAKAKQDRAFQKQQAAFRRVKDQAANHFSTITSQASDEFAATKTKLDKNVADAETVLKSITNVAELAQKTLYSITGGDSWALVYPNFTPRSLDHTLHVRNTGSYPLTSAEVRIYRNWPQGEVVQESALILQIPLGTLSPKGGRRIFDYSLPDLSWKASFYTIFVLSQGIGVNQKLQIRPATDGSGMEFQATILRVKGKKFKNFTTPDYEVTEIANTGWVKAGDFPTLEAK